MMANIPKNNVQAGEIDEALYSRQLFTLGTEAMKKMIQSSILIIGLGGLGVEVAKNVILSGAKRVTLYDTEIAKWTDLSAQFYLSEENVINHDNRAKTCLKSLSELNSYVKLDLFEGELNEDVLKQYSCVVITEVIPQIHEVSELCHNNKIKLVITNAVGLCGRVFCDFGENFVVNDINGEDAKEVNIKSVSLDKVGNAYKVFIITEDMHNLDSLDKVTISDVKGEGSLMKVINSDKPRKVVVQDKDSLELVFNDDEVSFLSEENSPTFEYIRGGIINQIKFPKEFSFKSYIEARKEPTYPECIWDPEPSNELHKCFEKYQEILLAKMELPRPYNDSDAKTFAKEVGLQESELALNFAKTCRGNINSVCAFVGGWAAQEVLKAVSGKYTPTTQFFYYSDFRAIPKHPEYKPTEENTKPMNCRYDGNIILLGKPYQEKLHKTNLFLIGAGALGCELLKQFALLGLATDPNYKVTVTDNDNIEKSNLSRQFLFRNTDVGKSKSEAASAAVKKMNKNINIDSLKLLVAQESMDTFNDQFWKKQDIICNAVDNVKARLFIDEKCVYYGKPLIDSGTLGPKANTQVVIPYLTESYSSSQDPEEASFPLCTIHQYPYNIQHTIAWAKDVFGGLFEVQPKDLKSYIENHEEFIRDATKEGANGSNRVLCVAKLLEDAPKFDNIETDWVRALSWARRLFEDYFANKPKDLLHKFPLDSVAESGEKFWIGSKRPPTPAVFDPSNELHMEFVYSAAKLYFGMFGLQPPVRNDERDTEIIKKKVTVPVFNPAVENIDGTVELDVALDKLKKATDEYEKCLTQKSHLKPDNITAIEFEKDDDTNGHVDFINAASNIRAINYDIEPVSKSKTKFIAGRIIPAMITTTALIVGLVGTDIIKMIDYSRFGFKTEGDNEEVKKLLELRGGVENFSCAFVNLALALYIPSDPIACSKRNIPGIPGDLTLWSFIDVNMKDFGENDTLGKVIEYLSETYKMEIMIITFGASMLWQSYGDFASREKLHIKQALSEASGEQFNGNVAEIIVVADPVVEESEAMEEPEDGYDYPIVRLFF